MWTTAQRKRAARTVGYLIGAVAGAIKWAPFTVHLVADPLGHVLGGMFIIGGVLAAWAQYRSNPYLEVAGLWLLNGAMGILAVGMYAESGVTHLSIALLFVAASFLFLGRIFELRSLVAASHEMRRERADR